jgi:hypothetical protein
MSGGGASGLLTANVLVRSAKESVDETKSLANERSPVLATIILPFCVLKRANCDPDDGSGLLADGAMLPIPPSLLLCRIVVQRAASTAILLQRHRAAQCYRESVLSIVDWRLHLDHCGRFVLAL